MNYGYSNARRKAVLAETHNTRSCARPAAEDEAEHQRILGMENTVMADFSIHHLLVGCGYGQPAGDSGSDLDSRLTVSLSVESNWSARSVVVVLSLECGGSPC